MVSQAPAPETARFLPVLTYIQTHLAGDLSLETLAEIGHLSPFHFHRSFRSAIGETLKQYTERLRLEQAAYHLKIRRAPIIEIALNAGFHSHETFTRAFRRRFGTTPSRYRRHEHIDHRLGKPEPVPLNRYQGEYRLSRTNFLELESVPVAFIRHLGPYVETDAGAFDRLVTWASQKGFYNGENLMIGVGHDDPGITSIEKVRYDACLEVPGPFKGEGEIGFQYVPGGFYAVTTYIGPYGPPLEQAYRDVFQQASDQQRYRLIGLPAVEMYRTNRINIDYSLNHTDIFLPVEKI